MKTKQLIKLLNHISNYRLGYIWGARFGHSIRPIDLSSGRVVFLRNALIPYAQIDHVNELIGKIIDGKGKVNIQQALHEMQSQRTPSTGLDQRHS